MQSVENAFQGCRYITFIVLGGCVFMRRYSCQFRCTARWRNIHSHASDDKCTRDYVCIKTSIVFEFLNTLLQKWTVQPLQWATRERYFFFTHTTNLHCVFTLCVHISSACCCSTGFFIVIVDIEATQYIYRPTTRISYWNYSQSISFWHPAIRPIVYIHVVILWSTYRAAISEHCSALQVNEVKY